MRTTPDNITSLNTNEVFVFGSNWAGRHGAGAALLARRKFGAKEGQGTGLMGQSYGIATKGHRLEVLTLRQIDLQVQHFIKFATSRPDLTFLVTKIGCGLAGYSVKDIAPMWKCALPSNIILPKEFQ